MTDVYTKTQRSELMSHISSKDTKPETIVRKYLFSQGFRYRKNLKTLPGTPDIVLPKYKTIIFINGCFWHGHKNCKASKLPETRKRFWKDKLQGNVERDKRNTAKLKKTGWRVITVWQCQINTIKKRASYFKKLSNRIKKAP